MYFLWLVVCYWCPVHGNILTVSLVTVHAGNICSVYCVEIFKGEKT
jgi:hypothetical protein